MAPPSQLSISTSALTRLVKEEASYHKELEEQKGRLAKLEGEDGDENKEYIVNQQKQAIDQTNAIFPSIRKRIKDAMQNLEEQLTAVQQEEGPNSADEIAKAKEAVAKAKEAYREPL